MRGSITFLCSTVLTIPALAGDIRSSGPAAESPPEIEQFGQFVGSWTCQTYARARDGSWQPNAWQNTWSWHWVLNGHAIQDVWEAPPESNNGWSMGTNLRIFDAETGVWHMAWTTTATRRFEFYRASLQGEDLVMTGDVQALGQRPPHSARITFHDIEADRFRWRYEASLQGPEGPWSEQARLDCSRRD